MMQSLHKMKTKDRSCDCCGSASFEELWQRNVIARTKTQSWEFNNIYVVCQTCGFVFVSPVPIQSDLQEYYADAYVALPSYEPEYDFQKRLLLIQQFCRNGDECIEIGSNVRTHFHDQLAQYFKTVTTCEIHPSGDAKYRSSFDAPDMFFDVVMSYFVLEHVPSASKFMEECSRIVKPDGIVIIEVPDIELYPAKISGLLAYDHLNHFSFENLAELASRTGFQVIGGGRDACSRDFGFAIILRKNSLCTALPVHCYEKNKESFVRGVEQFQSYMKYTQDVFEQIQLAIDSEKKIILWGANDHLKQCLIHGEFSPNCFIVVDSDPAKRDFLQGIEVHLPSEVHDQIAICDTIFLFAAKRHWSTIDEFLCQTHGKHFENVIFADWEIK